MPERRVDPDDGNTYTSLGGVRSEPCLFRFGQRDSNAARFEEVFAHYKAGHVIPSETLLGGVSLPGRGLHQERGAELLGPGIEQSDITASRSFCSLVLHIGTCPRRKDTTCNSCDGLAGLSISVFWKVHRLRVRKAELRSIPERSEAEILVWGRGKRHEHANSTLLGERS